MTSYEEIVSYCASTNPDLVYVAIGCSQAHYAPDEGTPQEYPPFVAAWPGRKVIIMIDPLLETPPRGYAQAGIRADPAPMVTDGTVTFFALRQNFHWPERWAPDLQAIDECTEFIHRLCRFAIARSHLIVQDYSGTNIAPFYPTDLGPALFNRVLFDVTGNDGGCLVDFSKIQVLRAPNGDFVQPMYAPLLRLQQLQSTALSAEIKRRADDLLNYVIRYYRVLRGLDIQRDWYSLPNVMRAAKPLFAAYGVECSADADSLYRLFSYGLFDVCTVAEHFMTEADVHELVHGQSFEQIRTSVHLLRDLACAENKEPR